ncbi:hypothetical protein ASPVEDRAFT_684586 [Aspergillus versicolor CBS 583.65]|uniref:Uncharacterized protein n=1 Tax=Aspergillus versicolor CBS 583.65 TaxID=1036611 RepID=A0A1L9PMG0_ASPVE|nr:uncharacterized protein ASPVEDRAFT_684586 [Aspergillus versicolor CBS 583.65]OJJ02605.1 hypothetical protein ASPVEDRAFT_684586 [Aspergillus versicolor CBS 583.65]
MTPNVSFVDPCYAYRMKEGEKMDTELAGRLASRFEDEILRVAPGQVARLVTETVGGTTLGCVPAVEGYFGNIWDICDKYGVLLILDEVICGMGTTGSMHAWQQERFAGQISRLSARLLGRASFLSLGFCCTRISLMYCLLGLVGWHMAIHSRYRDPSP